MDDFEGRQFLVESRDSRCRSFFRRYTTGNRRPRAENATETFVCSEASKFKVNDDECQRIRYL